jgi:prepilin-type N-terminal cleavage/methylation domain-containing protein
MPRVVSGFTLVELLVVITIIVVLLALLTPALDRALYQAEMALDGANLKAVALASTSYAAASRNRYPHRSALHKDATTDGQPNFLNNPWAGGGDPRSADDRYAMMDYLHLNALLDPLCDKIDIDPGSTRPYQKDAAQNSPEPFVMSGYQLFFGWQYAGGHQGMKKLGDRFAWSGTANLFNKATSDTFDVLATDQNSMTRDLRGIASSHPEDKGVLQLQTLRNEPAPSDTSVLGLNEGFYYVLSRWITNEATERRGALDLNTARTDGSVTRMNNVEWDEEERVTSAPIAKQGPGQFDYWLILPR